MKTTFINELLWKPARVLKFETMKVHTYVSLTVLSMVCVLLQALAILPLQADTVTWDGDGGDLNWNTAANWSDDMLPVAGDTAKFNGSVGSSEIVTLGANQVIGTLLFNYLASGATIGGGSSYSLTLTDGYIKGQDGGGSTALYIDAPVVLGAEGTFETYGGYGSRLTINQPISDGGSGYGVVLAARGNQSFTFKGDCTYSGDTVVRGRGFGLAGPDGAIKDSRLVLRQSSNQEVDAYMYNANSGQENSDRLSDTKAVRVEGSGGGLRLIGAGTSGVNIKEDAGTLELTSGSVKLTSTYNNTGKGQVELHFAGLSRNPGTGLVLLQNSTSDQYNWHNTPKVTMDDVADGILPYACAATRNISHVEAVDGRLQRVSYSTLPTSGGDSSTYYSTTGGTLTGRVQGNVLFFNNTSADGILDLGTNDLYLTNGSIAFKSENLTITGSVGRLIVGSQDVVFFGHTSGTRTMTVSTPIATDVLGPHNIVVPYANANLTIALTGEDQINTYSNLCTTSEGSAANAVLELGGSGDRSFSGNITGMMRLRKSGEGTLELNGKDLRGTGSMSVTGGRLVIGNANALRYSSWSNNDITVANAVLEVKEGISWNGRYTLNSGTILSGDGTFSRSKTIGNGSGVAPGHTVGTLTTAGLTFNDGSHFYWDLGNGNKTAGTDYDLLQVNGNFELPDDMITLHISDLGAHESSLVGQTFTIAQWTGSNPVNTPTWTIADESDGYLITTDVEITVNHDNKTIELTGLKRTPSGTLITVM